MTERTSLIEELKEAISVGRPIYPGDHFDYDEAASAALNVILKRLEEPSEAMMRAFYEGARSAVDNDESSAKFGLRALASHLRNAGGEG